MSELTTEYKYFTIGKVIGLVLLLSASSVNAIPIGGVEFPQGAISFADAVVSYNPDAGGAVPTAANSEPSNALGLPEVPSNTAIQACTGDPFACPFVSLGDGGFISLQFTDNVLTGSDDNSADLWIFEVGPDIEDTFVEISKDGSTWSGVGKVFGTTSGIDIDAFGFTSDDRFRYVRLTDDTNEGNQSGASVGADIDAVGAISTIPVTVDIEKLTNGQQADGENDSDVPTLNPGARVTWTYEVTNTGTIAFSEAEVTVTDSQAGVNPELDVSSDDGDMILSPGETWIYTATAQAVDLGNPPAGVTVVPGCGNDRNTYRNTGHVQILDSELSDEDLSHYCNSEDADKDGIEDHLDNCIMIPNGPLVPDAGGYSQRDTDGDGYGNICDPDFDNNKTINFADLAYLKSLFFSSDPDADLNGDGSVNFADLAILKSMFFGSPGPSGLAP